MGDENPLPEKQPKQPKASGRCRTDGSLSLSMQRFVDAFDGDAQAAALAAGYSPNAIAVTASRLLHTPKIAAAIRARESLKMKPLIKSREQRQAWWSKVMDDTTLDMVHRLQASQLLAKSEGDFITKVAGIVKHQHELPAGLSLEELQALARGPTQSLQATNPVVDAEFEEEEDDSD